MRTEELKMCKMKEVKKVENVGCRDERMPKVRKERGKEQAVEEAE